MAELVFVTGGARSGKSTFAERLAVAHRGPVAYVGTAAVTDQEMADRVERHRQRRPAEWSTVECTEGLDEAIMRAAGESACILVDCLTVYLARLLPPDLPDDRPVSRETVASVDGRAEREVEMILRACEMCGSDVIIVSNEVGSGLVPAYPSGRLFRDITGRANQRVAEAADHAYLVVDGCPLDLKALRAAELPWGGPR